MASDLLTLARQALLTTDVDQKLNQVEQLSAAWQAGNLALLSDSAYTGLEAGHPTRPQLVHPKKLPRRTLASEEGRLALIHAVTHIEFNAINLALDHICRFPGLPEAYYSDWLQVALEEVDHFKRLRQRLLDGGCDYGYFTAHNGLWDMAVRTADDPLIRMALIPRMLEARGLDVTPGMIKRFEGIGDSETVTALHIILEEEVGHVKIGSHWFKFLCQQRGLDSEQTYFDLLENHLNGGMRCPLHRAARLEAGFSEQELKRLEGLCQGR